LKHTLLEHIKYIISLEWLSKSTIDFPTEILPSKNRKGISCELSACVIFRHYEKSSEMDKITSSDQYINQKYIASQSSNLSDLSTYLRGVFNEAHGKIEIFGGEKEYFNFYCSPNEKVKTPKFEKDFRFNSNRSFWYVKIGDIDNQEIIYPSQNRNSKSFKAYSRVIHSPKRWNFWHFSIRWWIIPDQEIGFWLNDLDASKQRKYIKKIVSSSRSILAKNIKKNPIPRYKILEPRDYQLN